MITTFIIFYKFNEINNLILSGSVIKFNLRNRPIKLEGTIFDLNKVQFIDDTFVYYDTLHIMTKQVVYPYKNELDQLILAELNTSSKRTLMLESVKLFCCLEKKSTITGTNILFIYELYAWKGQLKWMLHASNSFMTPSFFQELLHDVNFNLSLPLDERRVYFILPVGGIKTKPHIIAYAQERPAVSFSKPCTKF